MTHQIDRKKFKQKKLDFIDERICSLEIVICLQENFKQEGIANRDKIIDKIDMEKNYTQDLIEKKEYNEGKSAYDLEKEKKAVEKRIEGLTKMIEQQNAELLKADQIIEQARKKIEEHERDRQTIETNYKV